MIREDHFLISRRPYAVNPNSPHTDPNQGGAEYSISRTTLDRVRAELMREDADPIKPVIINEMTDAYLGGPQLASAALYNTVLRRAVKAEAERDGHREVETTATEQAVARIRALHAPYRSVYDTDGQSCAHCNMYAAPAGIIVPWPCDTIRALDGE